MDEFAATAHHRELFSSDSDDNSRRVRTQINALAVDSPGYVPWWPRPDVKLFNILVHVVTETSRHAGHADILREQLDGSTGTAKYAKSQRDQAFWEDRRAEIERAAKAAATLADRSVSTTAQY